MGLWTWLQSLLFGEREARPPTALEDPRDTLDRAYERQLELRAQVQEGLAAVTAAKKRVELQARQLDAGFGRLEERARRDLTQGHEEAARQTLLRKNTGRPHWQLKARGVSGGGREGKLREVRAIIRTPGRPGRSSVQAALPSCGILQAQCCRRRDS